MNALTTKRPVASWLIAACGVWLVGLGLYFIAVRPPLLPEDTRFMGTTVAQIQATVPGLDAWLKKVFTVMGGFVAGTGVLAVFVAIVAMPPNLKGTSWAIALAGALTVALMSVTNFALDSDFKWLLLAPASRPRSKPHEAAQARAVQQRLLACLIGQVEPVLHEVHAQHALQPYGWASAFALGVMRLDHLAQLRPWHDHVHCLQEHVTLGGFAISLEPCLLIGGHRECLFLHT